MTTTLATLPRDPLTEALDGLELRRHMTEHPYRTLAVAVGVGYVLGGGLFTPFSARMVAVGLRAAVVPLLQQGVVTAARAVVADLQPSETPV